MSSAKQKFYVVWSGTEPGIYLTWDECKARTIGVKASRYKSFPTREQAEAAFAAGPPERKKTIVARKENGPDGAKNIGNLFEKGRKKNEKGRKKFPERPKTRGKYARQGKHMASALPDNPPDYRTDTVLLLPEEVSADAWAVDAACSGNPGLMEYRGVDLATGVQMFHYGPLFGTNNIGEFLAIVHALALLEKQHLTKTIYSDSRNALLWVKARKCRTTLAHNSKTAPVYDMIQRAEGWLATHEYKTSIKKWHTSDWGEIPADFGRK